MVSRIAPRRVRFADAHFNVSSRRVLDVGCGAGAHLRHFGPGSVGLELDPGAIKRGVAEGLDIRSWNFEEGIPSELRAGFEVVWASNLFEHVLAPHSFLIDVRAALLPGGRLIIVAPTTHRFIVGPFRGFLAADHVNFFTARTMSLTIERAGYRIETVASASFPGMPLLLASALRSISPGVLIAAVPIAGFDYPKKAHKRLIDGRVSFLGTLGDD
jgi:SAM-dependent methyltransferase